jgi:hypothetical protein
MMIVTAAEQQRLNFRESMLLLGTWVNKGGARSGTTGEQLINEPQHQERDADGD